MISASIEWQTVQAEVRVEFLRYLFPAAMALFLIHVRSRYGLGRYLVAATPFLAFAIVYRICRRDVPLGMWSGFSSTALLGAIASIVALCALRTRTTWAASVLVFASCLAMHHWIHRAMWVI